MLRVQIYPDNILFICFKILTTYVNPHLTLKLLNVNIKKQYWIFLLLVILPFACRSPYYAKAEKKPKKGYLNSITDKITGATTPSQHKTEGISYFKKGMTEEALEELKLASEGIKEDG